jgi:hypothetical protein
MNENLEVSVDFDSGRSWVMDTTTLNPTDSQHLLEHEQGHYNIEALMARDLFIQLMASNKGRVFKTQAEQARSVDDWVRIFRTNADLVQKAYDDDTGHSQANVFVPSTSTFTPPVSTKSSTQQKWERMIQEAFTTPRSPPQSAPDGTPYRLTLIDVLKKNGVSLSP